MEDWGAWAPREMRKSHRISMHFAYALVKAIKPAAERRDAKGKDTFDLGSFWRENEEGKDTDAFATVLRAVLANSPNSIPPERV